ncbi:MAG TPA: ferredoxin [Myxococcota bacterium]|nr:ferredoxin [Myxococcota bacterium]
MLRDRLKKRLKELVGNDEPARANDEPARPTAPPPTKAPVVEPVARKQNGFAALAAAAAAGELDEARHADEASTDVAAYAERARVNGRTIELAGAGLNVAEDGVEFLGPIDNESSRAKAAGLVLTIDRHECISCGTCIEHTEVVFFLGEDDKSGEEVKAEVLVQDGPMDLIQDAIDACPVTCIDWLAIGE